MEDDPIIVQCLLALREHPQHALAGSWKRQLWKKLGPVEPESHDLNRKNSGLARRFELAKQAVIHVLPEWQSTFPLDHRPLELLAVGEQFLKGSITAAKAMKAYDSGWVYADQVSGELLDREANKPWAGLVSYAACRALWISLHDEYLLTVMNDEETDPYLLDPAEYASAVMAHGHVNDVHSDNEARLAFWEWYLKYAYRAV